MSRPLVLATTIAALLAVEPSRAADIFWDGTGTSWDTASNWSTAIGAATPDPAAVPGASDIVIFHANGVTGAQNVKLDSAQSALGLATNATNKFLTTLVGGGTNQVLSLGTSGIDHLFGGLTIGSDTEGQKVAVSLLGSQTWKSSSSGTQNAAAINVLNGVSLGVTGTHTLTLDGLTTGGGIKGVISDGAGVLNLTKINPTGRWTLSGANTYTGVTTLSGGTLGISTIANGGVASNLGASSNAASNLVFDGGTLFYTGATASTDRSFTINAGKTATFDIESAATTLTFSGGTAATNGNLSKTGLGALEFSGAHTYSGNTTVTQGRLALSGAGSLATSNITIGQKGNGTTIDTLANTGVLTISGAGGTVTRTGNLTVNGGVLSNANNVRTLLVNGSDASDTHDIFGGITVNNGAFWGRIAPYAFNHTRVTFSSLTRAAGTQVHFDATQEGLGILPITEALAGTANVVFTTAPTAQMVGGTLGTPSAAILPFATVNGVLATYDSIYGLRALDTGTEMAELAGATAGQNASVTTAGTAAINADKTINSLWGTQGTVALGSRTLTVTSGAIAARGSYTIGESANDGTVALGATEGNVMVGNGAALTINSVITGSGGLTIGLTDSGSNAGTLVLGGANTFTGTTTIVGNNSSQRVTLTNALALQASTLDYNSYGGALRFGINDPGRGLVADLTSATIGALTGSQGLALTNSGPAGGGVALTVGSALNSANMTYSGTLSGAGSLIKDGTSTLTLAGGAANTYTGGTTIRQGIVILNKTAVTGTVNAIPGNLTIESGGKLQLLTNVNHQIADTADVVMSGSGSVFNGTGINIGVGNIAETIGSLTVTGGAVNAGTHANGITVTGMASFTGGAGNTVYVGNSASRFTVGGLTLKDMTELAGATVTTPNSFSVYGNNGTTRSKLTIGSLGLTLDNSVLTMRQGSAGMLGSQLVLNGNVTTLGTSPSTIHRDIAGLSGGQVSLDLSDTAGSFNRTFTIGDGGADLLVDMPIVNGAATAGSITKEGIGTMTMTGTSTYTGGTTINAGTLLANNTAGSATGTGPVSVSINGTLGGTGTISGAVTVASGGTLLGGTGLTATEDLALSGNVSLASDSVIKLTLGVPGAHSSLTRTGGLWSFAPAQAFSFIDLGAAPGFYDDILVGLGTAPASIGQWTITNAGFVGTFTYDGNNVDLNLTAVPEPGSAATLLGGLGLLGGFRRFRRRKG